MHKLLFALISLKLLAFLVGNPIESSEEHLISAYNISSSEEEELICINKVSKNTIDPDMEKLYEDINSHVQKFRDDPHKFSEKHTLYQETCKKIQSKVITFQFKMTLDLTPCLLNETEKEYRAYLKFSKRFSDFFCNLNETQFGAFDRHSDLSKLNNITECFARLNFLGTNEVQEGFFDDFCSVNQRESLDCTKKYLSEDDSDTYQFLEAFMNFFNGEFRCNSTENSITKTDEDIYLSRYYKLLTSSIGSAFIYHTFLEETE